jgi:lambda family phage minor tail protein L
MLTIPAALLPIKNALAQTGAWVILLEITLVDATVLRLTSNNADVTWSSQTWQTFPFELQDLLSTSQGEFPTLTIRVSNAGRIMQSYLEQGQGGIGSTVTVRVVHSQHLTETTPAIEETFDVVASSADAEWCSITLGAPNPIMARFPRHRYVRDHCRWIYKSTECGYTGALETCDRDMVDCRLHSNSARFGGFPGIPGAGFYRL